VNQSQEETATKAHTPTQEELEDIFYCKTSGAIINANITGGIDLVVGESVSATISVPDREVFHVDLNIWTVEKIDQTEHELKIYLKRKDSK
jgi:hypothetical protein